MQAESISDGGGFEDILYVLRPKIAAIMARYQIPPSDGPDVLQEVILAALERRRRQEPIQNLEAWLLTVLRNRCSIYQRKQICWKRLVQPLDPSELRDLAILIEPTQDYEAACRELRSLWHHLSADEKRLLWMCFGQDLRRREIAAQLRCHPANISKLLRRALARLREVARLRTAYR